ncbi:MAG: aspartate aminotransferase family protein [Lachnospiraceae bacterium]|jgi:aminotransferase, acetylornithine/succinylornithine family
MDDTALLHTYNRFPVIFEKGEGVRLFDTEGKEYLDFFSGIGVNALGYGYKKYTDRLSEQLGKLLHVSNYFYSEPLLSAAKRYTKASGMDKVFFTNSGAEAVEGALKLARKYAHEEKNDECNEIIAFNHSFHGRSIGAVSVTGTDSYRSPYGPLLTDVKFADYNDIESVRALVSDKTCAIILETIQGEGGIHVADKEFLSEIRNICDKNNIVMILDEVQCGMGRSGKMFAYQNYNIVPDVITTAKGIGCGVPVGAFACLEKFASLKPGDHGSTYGGNPFVTSAVDVCFQIFEEDGILENVCETGEYLYQKLEEIKEDYEFITAHRGMAMMQGLEFNCEVKDILSKALEKGLVLISAGSNIIRFLPPLIISRDDVDEMITILKEIFDENI